MKQFLLSTVLLVAIFPTLAHGQLWPQSQADRQAQAGQGHAQVPNYWANADAQEWSQTQVQALTWPCFKPTTSNPVFSLYDALGRPDNLRIGGMFRSRIIGTSRGRIIYSARLTWRERPIPAPLLRRRLRRANLQSRKLTSQKCSRDRVVPSRLGALQPLLPDTSTP